LTFTVRLVLWQYQMEKEMKRTTKPNRHVSSYDVMKSTRKPMPPPTKAINPKKKYDRRDKSWLHQDDED